MKYRVFKHVLSQLDHDPGFNRNPPTAEEHLYLYKQRTSKVYQYEEINNEEINAKYEYQKTNPQFKDKLKVF